MTKTILTLFELLDDYYYKEWVQDELRDLGLQTSGSKDELIDRFLNSKATQRTTVNNLGKRLVEDLRLDELRQIATYLGSATQGGRDKILNGVLDSVTFEPFIKHTKRQCKTCSRERLHELHFGDNWQAEYFVCEICRSIAPAQVPLEKDASLEEENSTNLIQNANIPSNEASHRIAIFAIALSAVAIFLTVAFALGLAYGWLVGISLGLLITVAAGYLLLRTRKLWESHLLKWIQ